ncbi:ROK family protein [Pseudoalteromonas sp. GB43]
MDISIDVGGTKIACALIEENQILKSKKVDSIIHQNLESLPIYLFDLIKDWLPKSSSVNVACTGQVSQDSVSFLSAGKKLPLKSRLEELTNLPVTIINDAAAAAWAEYELNQNLSKQDFVYITVSTGVGAGIVCNGNLITCQDGFCAHLGHTTVHVKGTNVYPCHCGRNNCVEAIASGTAIAKHASSVLGEIIDCKTAFDYSSQLRAVNEVINQAADAVSELIFNMKATLGNQHVVLGGSVGNSELFFEMVNERIKRASSLYQVTLIKPVTGANADMLGVHYYAQKLKGVELCKS